MDCRAHNSHIGDSTGTGRGGANFDRNETWNLGQMVRGTLPHSFSVGFYTYHGTVVAANSWGGGHEAMALKKALPQSYEAQFHKLSSKQGMDQFFLLSPPSDDVAPYASPCHPVPLLGSAGKSTLQGSAR